jgi:hypothetical protein
VADALGAISNVQYENAASVALTSIAGYLSWEWYVYFAKGGKQNIRNEINAEADQIARDTKQSVCDVLRDMRIDATNKGDTARVRKIQVAEKAAGCRKIGADRR